MFPNLKEDRAAEYHKLCLRRIWQRREYGESIDRYNCIAYYRRLWDNHLRDPWDRSETQAYTRMVQILCPWRYYSRTFWQGPLRRWEARHMNRKSRRETKVALRRGTLEDANEYEYWLPYID